MRIVQFDDTKDATESERFRRCEVRQDLPVQLDRRGVAGSDVTIFFRRHVLLVVGAVVQFQGGDESRITPPVLSTCRLQSHDPQFPIFALLATSVAVRVLPRLLDASDRNRVTIFRLAAISLGVLQQVLVL